MAAEVVLLLQVVVAVFTRGAGSTAGVRFTETLTGFLSGTKKEIIINHKIIKSERPHFLKGFYLRTRPLFLLFSLLVQPDMQTETCRCYDLTANETISAVYI